MWLVCVVFFTLCFYSWLAWGIDFKCFDGLNFMLVVLGCFVGFAISFGFECLLFLWFGFYFGFGGFLDRGYWCGFTGLRVICYVYWFAG